MDSLKCELYTMVKYFDFGNNKRFDQSKKIELLSGAIHARAVDHAPVRFNEATQECEICEDTFKRHYEIYKTAVESLYDYVEYNPNIRY